MTIQNWEQYKKNLWDWGILQGSFGDTKIEPTDFDGVIERKNQFLVIETKAPKVPIKTGQRITFESLMNTGCFTVLFVWGTPGKPCKIELWLRSGQKETYDPASLATLRDIVSQWFRWADKQCQK